MFFRGKQPEASIWRRFRASTDGFTFTESDGVYTAHIVANAERVVDLLHTLAEQLPPAVDVAIEDARERRAWRGTAVALAIGMGLHRKGEWKVQVSRTVIAERRSHALERADVGASEDAVRDMESRHIPPAAYPRLPPAGRHQGVPG